jgi:hypothetical protein
MPYVNEGTCNVQCISFTSKISVTALSGVAVITVLNWWLPHSQNKPLQFTSSCPVVSCHCDLNHSHNWHTEQLWKLKTSFPFYYLLLVFLNFLNMLMSLFFVTVSAFSTPYEPHTCNAKFLILSIEHYHRNPVETRPSRYLPVRDTCIPTCSMCFCCH